MCLFCRTSGPSNPCEVAPTTMSDSEHDASILGKRARNGPGADTSEDAEMKPAAPQDEDESDDDVGPMPMPEGADNAVTKKKRKGVFVQN